MEIDTNELVTSFGQARSYELFSRKVYLVVPKESEREIGRIESLCSGFDIGLVLFDKNNPQNPDFETRTRTMKSEPDYSYVNEYLRRLGEDSNKLKIAAKIGEAEQTRKAGLKKLEIAPFASAFGRGGRKGSSVFALLHPEPVNKIGSDVFKCTPPASNRVLHPALCKGFFV
ncbi:MAG: hypothetical protein V2G42_03590 [bacterium JZ-2024 1]